MPDATPIPEKVRTFLGEPNWATIATLNEDGSAHQAVIWFLIDADVVVVNSRPERHWPRNLERDPRVSLAIQDRKQPEHWVGLHGHARLVRTGDAAMADIAALARRYGGDSSRFGGQDRVTFEIRVERTFEYGS